MTIKRDENQNYLLYTVDQADLRSRKLLAFRRRASTDREGKPFLDKAFLAGVCLAFFRYPVYRTIISYNVFGRIMERLNYS